MKIIVIIAFILILFSLAKALLHLIKHKNDADSEKTMKALMVRSIISVLLFALLFFAVATGMIKPHGVGVQMHKQSNLPSQQTQ
jgi:O-antigen/teichoic acid export membrane protein